VRLRAVSSGIGVTATASVPQDPNFESRVRASFDKQRFMSTIGGRIIRVVPGEVDVEVAMRDDLVH
jgi:acyl-coenzyme A thioesterase PaaI-like protein